MIHNDFLNHCPSSQGCVCPNQLCKGLYICNSCISDVYIEGVLDTEKHGGVLISGYPE